MPCNELQQWILITGFIYVIWDLSSCLWWTKNAKGIIISIRRASRIILINISPRSTLKLDLHANLETAKLHFQRFIGSLRQSPNEKWETIFSLWRNNSIISSDIKRFDVVTKKPRTLGGRKNSMRIGSLIRLWENLRIIIKLVYHDYRSATLSTAINTSLYNDIVLVYVRLIHNPKISHFW